MPVAYSSIPDLSSFCGLVEVGATEREGLAAYEIDVRM